jgi:hypothetical protein
LANSSAAVLPDNETGGGSGVNEVGTAAVSCADRATKSVGKMIGHFERTRHKRSQFTGRLEDVHGGALIPSTAWFCRCQQVGCVS